MTVLDAFVDLEAVEPGEEICRRVYERLSKANVLLFRDITDMTTPPDGDILVWHEEFFDMIYESASVIVPTTSERAEIPETEAVELAREYGKPIMLLVID